jgi:hypothetical protein
LPSSESGLRSGAASVSGSAHISGSAHSAQSGIGVYETSSVEEGP